MTDIPPKKSETNVFKLSTMAVGFEDTASLHI
jgi:hypothetical protein